MAFLSSEGVRLTGCGPEDFVDYNINKVLSVVWQVILKYQIQAQLLNTGILPICNIVSNVIQNI